MNERILCVDDDENILKGYQRSLRGRFSLTTAVGAEPALSILKQESAFAVIVSDLRMPGMDGIQFLSKAKEMCPDTVRMMLTGNADLQASIQAVNEGHIFRFLTKPCPPDTLALALNAGIRQHQLVIAEKELLEKTLRGSVKILTDILSMLSPAAFGRSTRIRPVAARIAQILHLQDCWKLEVAAMLSQVGCVAVPPEILEAAFRGDTLPPHKKRIFQEHPQVGHDLIANIPRLEDVAEIILYQEKQFNGLGFPDNETKGKDIPIGGRILHVVLTYDSFVNSGMGQTDALKRLHQSEGRYDQKIVAALFEAVEDEIAKEVHEVTLSELLPGMVFAEDVCAVSGTLLVVNGQEVTGSLKRRLENFSRTLKLREPLRVYFPLHS